MMFRKHDRLLMQEINAKLDQIKKHMADDRDALDKGLAQNKQDIADAAQRVVDTVAAIQAKIDAGQSFTAELATLNEAHTALQAIAAPPTPPPIQGSPATV